MRFYNCKINKYQDTDDLSADELKELGLPIPKAKVKEGQVSKEKSEPPTKTDSSEEKK